MHTGFTAFGWDGGLDLKNCGLSVVEIDLLELEHLNYSELVLVGS